MTARPLNTAAVVLLTIFIVGRGSSMIAGDLAAADVMKFERDIQPILAAAGCSAGACHGKQRGQNGFQLSLLGFDPDFDFSAITTEGRGRRIFPAVPEQSLLLRKASGQVSHGGGVRLEAGGVHYEMVRTWISQGTPRVGAADPVLARIEVQPAEQALGNDARLQLKVLACYSDGSQRDVTSMAAFQSNEAAIASVDRSGLVKTGPLPGEAAIMTRYLDKIATAAIAIPQPGEVDAQVYAQLPRFNFVDEHVWNKLQKLGITPSAPADDFKLARRLYVDLIGRMPTPDEVAAFAQDVSLDKRRRLIDELLERPEYADHWANKWADLLRPNPYRVGIKSVLNFDVWIRDSFRQNKPYDQFVRELVAAQGSTYRNGAVTLFRDHREPEELAPVVSQLFLGVRLECAKCHHHPFEVWSQDDFFSFSAYFNKIARKGTGLSPPISGSEEIFFTGDAKPVMHPRTNKEMTPRPLFGQQPEIAAEDDPRDSLAAWITGPDNRYFEQVIVNRLWADLMGRGLVEPVDDLRGTNPPTNAPLLAALGEDFRRHGCDLKHTLRTIASSYVYGLSSQPHERNVADSQNYSRHYRRRLRGEVLLDAICDLTDVPESFSVLPQRSRAAELWTHRASSLFLDAFGRPDPNQDPPCERLEDATVVQALHLMNAPSLNRKLTDDDGRAAKLAASDKSPREIATELYLRAYAREPAEDELSTAVKVLEVAGKDRRRAVEDLMWALINTPEFVFKD